MRSRITALTACRTLVRSPFTPIALRARSCVANAASTERRHPTEGAELLNGLRVVLVSPKHAGNVGSVCRLCDNFELTDLVVVDPRCAMDDPGIGVMATNKPYVENRDPSATMGNMRVVDTLAEALSDTVASVALTRRTGKIRKNFSSITELLESEEAKVLVPLGAAQPSRKTALVFGREESGLTSQELQLCSLACGIPTGRIHPSLNLSHAVGVVLAGVFERASLREEGAWAAPDATQAQALATNEDIDVLLSRWKEATMALDVDSEEVVYSKAHGAKTKVLGHLRNVLLRANATDKEVRALHGLCSALKQGLNGE